jgi:hypothetical protein
MKLTYDFELENESITVELSVEINEDLTYNDESLSFKYFDCEMDRLEQSSLTDDELDNIYKRGLDVIDDYIFDAIYIGNNSYKTKH